MEWNPSYKKYNRKTELIEEIFYDKSWYCNENKLIHKNEKDKNNCKHCNEDNNQRTTVRE